MNLIQIRDKLNELIEQGMGNHVLITDLEGLSIVQHFSEGFVSSTKDAFGNDRENFHTIEELTDSDYISEWHKNHNDNHRKNKIYDAVDIY